MSDALFSFSWFSVLVTCSRVVGLRVNCGGGGGGGGGGGDDEVGIVLLVLCLTVMK